MDPEPAPRFFITFALVTGLYRPIFGTHIRLFLPIRAQNRLHPKHATDFLAFPAENMYRIWPTEAKMASDGFTPPGRDLYDGSTPHKPTVRPISPT